MTQPSDVDDRIYIPGHGYVDEIFEVRFVDTELTELRKLCDNLDMTGQEAQVLTKAVRFYQMVYDWYGQGNRIEMITPPKPETREDLVLP